VARVNLPKDKLMAIAEEKIRKARMETTILMEKGIIPAYKE
jgi:hypothetical protein